MRNSRSSDPPYMRQRRDDGRDYSLPVAPHMEYTEPFQIVRSSPEKGVYNLALDMDRSVSYYSTEADVVMKTIRTLALLFSVASTVKCQFAALGGNYVDPAIQGPKVPMVWLLWGTSILSSRLRGPVVTMLIHLDDHGVQRYSPGYRLGDECHKDLIEYKGIWIQADPRPPQSQKGCGVSYSNGDCTGSVHKFELEFTGMSFFPH